MGIRSLECNFNPEKRTYNPHLHLVVPDRETALILIQECLRYWTPTHAGRGGQHYREVGSMEKDLIDTIKYGSKIYTEPDRDKNIQSQVSPKVYAAALYNIYAAMKGLRIFDRFGFDLPKLERALKPAQITTEYEEWVYLPEHQDWQATENEQLLLGVALTDDLKELFQNAVDTEFE